MENERNKQPRKRSNPSKKPVEIKISLVVNAHRESGTLDIREFNIEPSDELTIGEIGALLGNNVANFLVGQTKPASNIKI